MITLDLSKAKLNENLESYKDAVKEIHDMIPVSYTHLPLHSFHS